MKQIVAIFRWRAQKPHVVDPPIDAKGYEVCASCNGKMKLEMYIIAEMTRQANSLLLDWPISSDYACCFAPWT
jgi:hypothetical protein